MRFILSVAGAIALLWAGLQSAGASSLRVSPTAIDMVAPSRTAVLRLRNDSSHPVHVQLRLFRWSQHGGVEKLEPTTDVVASPPTSKLDPGVDYVVRVVYVSKKPLRAEESFRVLVDEVPLRSARRAGTVNLVIRHSIPIFIRDANVKPPTVDWSIGVSGTSLLLAARNAGEGRLKLFDLHLSQGGRKIAARTGLLGYVLGGSEMTFKLDHSAKVAQGPIRLQARTNSGPIDTTASIKGK